MSGNPMRHVAIDLGASGGRVALGSVEAGALNFEILHRFPNSAVALGNNLYWNILELWREIRHGLRLAASRGKIASIGITTWGVDYALLDHDRNLIGMVHSHRDRRTETVVATLDATMPVADIYQATGIQFLTINTLPQLVAARASAPQSFERAAHLLMLPDLLNFWLTGIIASEHSIASTSQMYDPTKRDWSDAVLGAFGFPRALFPKLVEPGTILGPLLPEIARDIGLSDTVVIAPAGHDTASAVAAIPAESDGKWAYVATGTWCLAGIEQPHPFLSETARCANVTNEQGVAATTRLLKNTSGLFVLQECFRAWGDPPIEPLLAEATASDNDTIIDIIDQCFMTPGPDMPARIAEWCTTHGTAPPKSHGAMTRVILRSLAAAIARSLADVDHVSGHRTARIHVVGGGARIALFNKAIAGATGVPVLAGPVEATVSGNFLIQAEAMGVIPQGEIRTLMRRTTPCVTFTPQGHP